MSIVLFGPYRRKDGRYHVIHYDNVTRKRVTQSYPRYLMEQHLDRKLESWEQVDHVNNDHTDNRIENFQILTVTENNRKSVKANGRKTKYISCVCPTCGIEFYALLRQYTGNQIKQGKDGPFCSRSCAGQMYH